jgi:hypothetical protein
MYVKVESNAVVFPLSVTEREILESDAVIGTDTKVRAIPVDGSFGPYLIEVVYQIDTPQEVTDLVASLPYDGKWPEDKRSDAAHKMVEAQHTAGWRRLGLVLKGLRWRLGDSTIETGRRWGSIAISVDGEKWQELYPPTPGPGRVLTWPYLLPEWLSEAFKEGVSLCQTVPLGHELLRDARLLARNNPRSALVMLVAAAEIGFKQSVATAGGKRRLSLQTWVDEMGELVIPFKLEINGKEPHPPDTVRREVRSAVRKRNKVVHEGYRTISQRRVDEYLDAVKDLLYLLDFYAGHMWAWASISKETRDILEKSDVVPSDTKV